MSVRPDTFLPADNQKLRLGQSWDPAQRQRKQHQHYNLLERRVRRLAQIILLYSLYVGMVVIHCIKMVSICFTFWALHDRTFTQRATYRFLNISVF